MSDHLAVCDNSYVAAFSLYFAFANGDKVVIGHGFLGHWEGDTVHHLIFQEDNGVGITNCRLIKKNNEAWSYKREGHIYFE